MHEAMGVKLELIKFGEHKAEGNNLGPLTDSARAHMQEMVDIYGNAFERAVARGRGIKQDLVHSKFGQGRVFDAKTAVRIGMADMVGTLADVLSALSTSAAPGRQAQFAAMRHQLSMAAGEGYASAPASAAAKKKALEAEFARMRHDLAMAKAGTVAAPNGGKKRAGDGDADDCGCDCVPCDGGDCDGCDCDACECEGCDCDSAVAKAARKEDARR